MNSCTNKEQIKLFCIPHAGGYASQYFKLGRFLNYPVKLIPIEFAGRGMRYTENPYTDFNEAVNDVCNQIKENINSSAFAIFGHSMGGLLAYEVGIRLSEYELENLKHIFISGSSPPQLSDHSIFLHLLSDNDFLEEIVKLGGIPREISYHREMLNLFLPVLKNDFRIFELYITKNTRVSKRLSCDLTVFGGFKDDIVKYEDIKHWRSFTNSDFQMHFFDGNHFFINDHLNDIASILTIQLLKNK